MYLLLRVISNNEGRNNCLRHDQKAKGKTLIVGHIYPPPKKKKDAIYFGTRCPDEKKASKHDTKARRQSHEQAKTESERMNFQVQTCEDEDM